MKVREKKRIEGKKPEPPGKLVTPKAAKPDKSLGIRGEDRG